MATHHVCSFFVARSIIGLNKINFYRIDDIFKSIFTLLQILIDNLFGMFVCPECIRPLHQRAGDGRYVCRRCPVGGWSQRSFSDTTGLLYPSPVTIVSSLSYKLLESTVSVLRPARHFIAGIRTRVVYTCLCFEPHCDQAAVIFPEGLCVSHVPSKLKFSLQESTILGAGVGLFTASHIRRGQVLGIYHGERRPSNVVIPSIPLTYVAETQSGDHIDAFRFPCLMSYINDPTLGGNLASGRAADVGDVNTKFSYSDKGIPVVVAVEDIEAAEEVLIEYSHAPMSHSVLELGRPKRRRRAAMSRHPSMRRSTTANTTVAGCGGPVSVPDRHSAQEHETVQGVASSSSATPTSEHIISSPLSFYSAGSHNPNPNPNPSSASEDERNPFGGDDICPMDLVPSSAADSRRHDEHVQESAIAPGGCLRELQCDIDGRIELSSQSESDCSDTSAPRGSGECRSSEVRSSGVMRFVGIRPV
ncbi:MAG: hypothetical protein Q7U84_10835, partial [Polynucleobacter sp.]|nr:hypothetical protein [Polynucleobacter sp.]